MFLDVVCVSWKIKWWILLMHGVTMKYAGEVFHSWRSTVRSWVHNLVTSIRVKKITACYCSVY